MSKGSKDGQPKKVNNARLFWMIIKKCNFEKVLIAFILFFALAALIITIREPDINTYGDGLWYCFVACTSIGFGDFVAVSALGRVITVLLTLFEIVLIALLSGVIVSHYLEVIHTREKISATMFLDKLEHLSQLSDEELVEIEEKVKEFSKNNG